MSWLVPVPRPALVWALETGPPSSAVAWPHQPSCGMSRASTMLPATASTGEPAARGVLLNRPLAANSSTRLRALWLAARAMMSAPPPVKIVSASVVLCVPVNRSLPIEPPSTLPAVAEPMMVSPVLAATDSA